MCQLGQITGIEQFANNLLQIINYVYLRTIIFFIYSNNSRDYLKSQRIKISHTHIAIACFAINMGICQLITKRDVQTNVDRDAPCSYNSARLFLQV